MDLSLNNLTSMNVLIPIAILLILGIIYISTTQQKSKLMAVLTIIVVIIFVCLVDMKETYVNHRVERFAGDQGYDLSAPAPLNYKMGECSGIDIAKNNQSGRFMWNYDNLTLKSNDPNDPKCPYGRVPCDAPLISDVTIFSPVGDGIRLTEDLQSATFPTVDGTPGTPHQLFMLAHNQTGPQCCPSTFSTDRGCVCLTKAQRDLINGRGTNRRAPDEF